ncbi:MAG TPA: FliH/SctL family protein, partial [Phycisphaerae bacterium]|nr:FliH/SctL family protein [Phycisphaerae bacterium]
MNRQPTIIKARSAGPESLGARAFVVNDVLREARGVLTAAQRNAAELCKQARAQVTEIREQARREGREAGFIAGREDGLQSGRDEAFALARREFGEQQRLLIAACEDLIGQIETGRALWLASARQDLVELAMAIARRVVHHVGQRERNVVLANLEEAVRLAGRRSEVTLVVHPADTAAAQAFADGLLGRKGQWKHVEIVEDPRMSPGGCRVHWDSGAV